MIEANEQVLCYVAVHRECGFPVGVCVDEPQYAKDNAEIVSPWIADATLRVERWTVKTVRESKFCKCKNRQRKIR